MAVGYSNLTPQIQGMLNRGLPDVGQIFYMVDSDFRTAAQGWSQADGTGPLDLWQGRHEGTTYVYRTADHTSDAVALQAAMDAAVDFRGDIIHFTPGAYSIATVITVDVPSVRLLGPPIPHPAGQRASITGTVGLTWTVSVDDVEMGYLRFVPLTATENISVSNGADRGYVHHYHWDSRGVGADLGTEFVNSIDTTTGWLFERGFHVVDAVQGDCFTLEGAIEWTFRDLQFYTKVASYPTCFTLGTNCEGCFGERLAFWGDADGTFTRLITGETNSDAQMLWWDCVYSDKAMATLDAIETGFGTDLDFQVAQVWQATSDAAQSGIRYDPA